MAEAASPTLLFVSQKKDSRWLYALGFVLALGIHVGGATAAKNAPLQKKQKPIEMAVVKKAKPPPPPAPPPPEPPKPEPPKPPPPKKVAKAPVKQEKPIEPPAPPPPNSKPPPEPPKKPVPILSGVTLESTVEGPSTFAVAVGNTMYDDPNKNDGKTKAEKYSAPAYREAPAPPTTGGTSLSPRPWKPVPKFSISTEPEVETEVKARYPAEAKSAGIEGVVDLRVEIWEDGTVRSVKVVRGLGYGLDEAAVEAMKRFRFKPATVDGRGVQYTIPRYAFRFELQG